MIAIFPSLLTFNLFIIYSEKKGVKGQCQALMMMSLQYNKVGHRQGEFSSWQALDQDSKSACNSWSSGIQTSSDLLHEQG